MIALIGQGVAEFAVDAECIGSFDGIVKHIPDELLIMGDAVLARAVLGRVSVRGDQRPVRQGFQPIKPEFTDLFHHRVCQRAQVFAVAGKRIVFPNILHAPRTARCHPLPS
jgi:hypothetical protein